MRKFQDIYELAVIHKGGVDALEALLPQAATADTLRSLSDDVYLSTMSRRIFRAGLKHSLVDAKWDYFEKVFHGFDPFFCAMLSDEDIENLMTDKGLIRHLGKIKSIRLNGQFVRSVAQDYGSFADYLVQFSHAELIDLWSQLKKRGHHLGGSSGAQFLRMVGKDTFLLTNDVVAVMKLEGVIEKHPTSQRDIQAVHAAFMQWHQQSNRDLCEISRIVSCVAL